MKRIFYLLSAALMIMVSSCSKDEQPVNNDEVKMVQATINAESTDSGTKTTASRTTDEEGNVIYKIAWEAGDELSVFNSTNTMTKFTAASAGAKTKFNGEMPEGSTINYAILPYDAKATVSGTTVYTSIPAEQNGDFGNIVLAGWPKDASQTKIAVEDYNFNFQFEAVSGILKFTFDRNKIDGGKNIISVDIIADRPIAGDAKISYANGKPVMTPNPNATGTNVSNTITLSSATGLADGDYYFATFPVLKDKVATMGISMKFVASDGDVAYVNATLGKDNSKILEANVVKNVGTVKIEEFEPVPFTSGEFTVDGEGNKVTFSRGNLQYQASSGKWRFANHQWDIQGALGNSTAPAAQNDEGSRKNQSEWIDLFPWGGTGFTFEGYTYTPYASLGEGTHTYAGSQYNGAGMPRSQAVNVLTGKFADFDWGHFCQINNGYDLDDAGTWRLLCTSEMNYIINSRSQDYRYLRYGIQIGIDMEGEPIIRYGVILFPDGFAWPTEILPVPEGARFNDQYLAYDKSFTLPQLSMLEQSGCIFLPAAGFRQTATTNPQGKYIPIEIQNINEYARYWTNSPIGTALSHFAAYQQNMSMETGKTTFAESVRLVKNVK